MWGDFPKVLEMVCGVAQNRVQEVCWPGSRVCSLYHVYSSMFKETGGKKSVCGKTMLYPHVERIPKCINSSDQSIERTLKSFSPASCFPTKKPKWLRLKVSSSLFHSHWLLTLVSKEYLEWSERILQLNIYKALNNQAGALKKFFNKHLFN